MEEATTLLDNRNLYEIVRVAAALDAARAEAEKAYRRGKVNGYGEGLIAGWDEARSRARKLFDSLLSDDSQIADWRARMIELEKMGFSDERISDE